MKTSMIAWIDLVACDASDVERVCDEVAEMFGLSKRVAGLLPDRRPVGYIYSSEQIHFHLSLLAMGNPPYAKIQVRMASNADLGATLHDTLKAKLDLNFDERWRLIGEG